VTKFKGAELAIGTCWLPNTEFMGMMLFSGAYGLISVIACFQNGHQRPSVDFLIQRRRRFQRSVDFVIKLNISVMNPKQLQLRRFCSPVQTVSFCFRMKVTSFRAILNNIVS
jgi:hypothetical protein